MFTFEERFNEGITGTDAKTNGQTAADVMKVVKEEVLLVRTHMGTNRYCSLHVWLAFEGEGKRGLQGLARGL